MGSLPADIAAAPSSAPAQESESLVDEDDRSDDETDDGGNNIPSVRLIHSLPPIAQPYPRFMCVMSDVFELMFFAARTSLKRRYSVKYLTSMMGTRKSSRLK